MSAPICGARTWVEPGVMVKCDRTDAHNEHEALCEEGSVSWKDPSVRIDGASLAFVELLSPDQARALVASLQRQLDALDPDAAIAEAERRMLDARDRAVRRLGLAASRKHVAALGRASKAAYADECAAVDTWLALVEARDAKGGGA